MCCFTIFLVFDCLSIMVKFFPTSNPYCFIVQVSLIVVK